MAGFGSFSSGDVEELLRGGGAVIPRQPARAGVDDGEAGFFRAWVDGTEPARMAAGAVDAAVIAAVARPFVWGPAADELGKRIKADLFRLDDRWGVYVNHGAFGAELAVAARAAAAWRDRAEQQPLRYVDRRVFPLLVAATRELAGFIQCAPADLALTQNATHGLSTVIARVIPGLPPGRQTVFALDLAYGAVKTMLREACAACGADLVLAEVPPSALVSAEALVEFIRRAVPATTGFAVLDHVTSNTAVAVPVAAAAAAVRGAAAGPVLVAVDGAHGLIGGGDRLDVAGLGVDFYAGSCYKWLCAPKGVGFLWARPAAQALVRPLIVSHGFGHGFASGLLWDGCRDYAAAVALPVALAVWARLGVPAARARMAATLGAAVDMLTAAWGTSALVSAESGLRPAMMALVAVPPAAAAGPSRDTDPDPDYFARLSPAQAFQDRLYFYYRIECPCKLVHAVVHVRISAHLYNTPSDYAALRDAVLALASPGRRAGAGAAAAL